MLKHSSIFALICWGSCVALACSSTDSGPGSNGVGGAATAGKGGSAGSVAAAGSTSSAGSSAAGSSNAAGAGGASTAGAGGASAAGASAAGSAGATGGSAGAAGSGNTSCVPGTDTMPVGEKSVLDRKTCLTWTKTRSSTTLTNKDAAKYCANLTQDGISDWRVPRPEELVTWRELATDGTAYITGPIYIPNAGSVQDGCTGNSHSCNIAKYNDTSVTCAWQGVGFSGWVECVSGTASAGTTRPAYAASSCSPCNGVLATFKETDCSAFTP